jgi:CHAT domain-containing protein/tetratricopeptide (TPR) repeat protein
MLAQHLLRCRLAAWAPALVLLPGGAGGSAGVSSQDPRAPSTATPEAAFQEQLASIKVLEQAGQYAEAIEAAKALVPAAEEAFGHESLEVADALAALLTVSDRAVNRGKLPQVSRAALLPAAERCLAIRERLLGPDHVLVAEALAQLGWAHWSRGDFRQRRDLMARALTIYEARLGPDDPDLANGMIELGRAEGQLANFARVRELHEKAAAIYSKSTSPQARRELAICLEGQGYAAQRLGDVAEAERLFRMALAISEELPDSVRSRTAPILLLLADALLERGAHDEARSVLERALVISEKTFGPGDHRTARVLRQLAVVLWKQGDLPGARRAMRRSLEMQELASGRDHPVVAVHLQALAEILVEQGEATEARALAERALAIRETSLGTDHPLTAETMRLLASLTEDPAAALRLLDHALAATRAGFGPFHPDVARILSDRARLLLRRGDAAAAMASALEAEASAREWLRLALGSLDERSALAAVRHAARGIDIALSAAAMGAEPGAIEGVLDAVVRSRALVLDEIAARHRVARSSSDPEIGRLEAVLATSRERLARLALRAAGDDPGEGDRRLIQEAQREKEDAEAALAARSRLFREERDESQRGIAAVRAALGGDDALVSFVQYRREGRPADRTPPVLSYGAFVTRPREAVTFVPLGDAARIDALVARWRKVLLRERGGVAGTEPRGSLADYRAAALGLRRAIWDPLEARFRGAVRVVLVPDGALHLVSFAALPARGGAYLLESAPLVHYVTAERDLAAPISDASNRGLLALGDPDFESATPTVPGEEPAAQTPAGDSDATRASSACHAFDSLRFAPLPASGREVDDLAAPFDPADTLRLRRGAAGEGAVKELARGRRVLHLATHAFFLGEDCPSALTPSRSDGEAFPSAQAPLLRAGLALAGANRRASAPPGGEDGILTAEEIAGLDLRGMEWAVLSACGTGVGEIAAGEGVLGLSRAFRVAGAGTTIMSLWAVDDEGTRRWMRALYRSRFEQGKTTDEAVHAASLESLRERRSRGRSTHPFHWAGFIASGSW